MDGTTMPNLLTETNLILDSCVPRQLTHVQIPDLPISTYTDVGEACRDIAGQLTAAGESGVAVLEDICRHFSLHSEHLDRFISDIQARGVTMGSAYIPGGPLPVWVTTVPEIFGETVEKGWMSSLSHSLKFLWDCLRTYTTEVVVGAIVVVAVILQLRRNAGTRNAGTGNDRPPIREDEVSVSQPAIACGPSATGGQGTTDLSASVNQALGHLPPTQACCQYPEKKRKGMEEVSVNPGEVKHVSKKRKATDGVSVDPSEAERVSKKKRKATDEVSVDPSEAEHVSKKRQTFDSCIAILTNPAIETAVLPKPTPRKKRGRPRKHNVA